MHTLKLSYDQLDARLKLCVTYCSIFRKGGEFLRDEMIHRWIALDYVKPTYENQSLEEAGEDYMINLHNSGFLELELDDPYDTRILFTMPDVMYELVLSLAGFKYMVADSNTDEIDKRVRHLSFWKAAAATGNSLSNEYLEVPSSISKIKHLQSLVRGNAASSRMLYERYLSMSNKSISKLYHLRVLDIDGVKIKELPTSIGELISLRYLNLCRTEIEKLPNSITRLVKLQSLIVESSQLKELPRDMSTLVNLRHLMLGGSKLRHMPMGLGNLTNLTTLDVFIVGKHSESKVNNIGRLADLNQLNNLRGYLRIDVRMESTYTLSSEISATNLKMKLNLQQLFIGFKCCTKEDERVFQSLHLPSNLRVLHINGYGGEKLPGWMMNRLEIHLPNLVKVHISGCNACKYLCAFGRLPNLKFLDLAWLRELVFVEDSIDGNNFNNSDNAVEELSPTHLFPSLIRFGVKQIPKLKGWWKTSSSSSEQESRDFHQTQHLVNWNHAFPKLNILIVDELELAITIARQHLGGFTSLKTLWVHSGCFDQRPAPTPTLLLSSYFPNLHRLCVADNPRLDFPEAIRDLSSLQFLIIRRCGNMKAIPEWIDSLTSLQTLELIDCQGFESLPHQIANLPNLIKLTICRCRVLVERCQSPNGEYWPLIQHIPHLSIQQS